MLTTTLVAQPSSLGLVIPCYNEAFRLDIQAFNAQLKDASGPFLLFVDDGSTDQTGRMLEELVARCPPTRASVLRLPHNGGKAEAVRRGILALIDRPGVEFVGFWDADLATPLDEIADFLAVFELNPTVQWVIGSRVRLLGRDIRRRPLRHYLGRVFATTASLMLSLPVYDTQCGAKLFRANDALRKVVATPFVSRWIFDVEMIARFLALPMHLAVPDAAGSIYEIPLRRWMDVEGSKVGIRDVFLTCIHLLRIHSSRLTSREDS